MRPLLTFAVMLLLAAPAFAWTRGGHMVSALIAFDVLKQDDPAALARVLNMLRHHPQYADRFAELLDAVPAEERDRFLFCLAARWPDDIRRNQLFHRSPWHFINYPFKPKGQPDSVNAPAPLTPNILTAYAENVERMKGDASPGHAAIAICWVFHLVGDVHQPLHTVSLYTADYPDGDRGGNRVFVRGKPGGAIVNLHSLWDGLVLGSNRFSDARNVATALRLRPDLTRDKDGTCRAEFRAVGARKFRAGATRRVPRRQAAG